MDGNNRTKIPFPCCIYKVTDTDKIYRSFHLQQIKDYGDEVKLADGTLLHKDDKGKDNDGGWTGRKLVRCCDCGALFLNFYTYYYDMYDPYSVETWCPVASEEEADLLNILLDGKREFGMGPVREILRSDWNYSWTAGADPVPCDPEELRRLIREAYADADPELLEDLIRGAGTEHAAEKTPMPKPAKRKKKNGPKDYRYMARFDYDPPTLIRLGSFEDMEADMYAYPGFWKDTPRLNDIRVGLGNVMDYDDITEAEAMEIKKELQAYYDRLSAKDKEETK